MGSCPGKCNAVVCGVHNASNFFKKMTGWILVTSDLWYKESSNRTVITEIPYLSNFSI